MSFDLDFINRPNPVEPSALNHGSLTGKARELDRSTNEHLIPFLLSSRLTQPRRDSPVEAAGSRRAHAQTSGASIAAVLNNDEGSSHRLVEQSPIRRDADQALYTLPKLPVKRGTKRHRVPPVLQGLHQPPPTSGLLPSISAEDTQVLLSTTGRNRPTTETALEKICSLPSTSEVTVATPQQATKAPSKRVANRWTEQETKDLLDGVAKFGIGSWKKILLCSNYVFNKRTAVDLKDRFRVCKPNAYGRPRTKKAKAEAENRSTTTTAFGSTALSLPEPLGEDLGQSKSTEADSDRTKIPTDNAGQRSRSNVETTLWKVNRRQRRRFTAQEDTALLNGYIEHGISWMSIVKDPVFRENDRKPTDLRDRFRTRYPEKYAESGLAPRPGNFPKPLPRTQPLTEEEDEEDEEIAEPPPASSAEQVHLEYTAQTIVPPTKPAKHSMPTHTHGIPFPGMAEDYLPEFGLPEDDDDADPIVLDRSIMDWANSTMPSSSNLRLQPLLTGDSVAGTFPGIDPLVTLKLPRPGLF
ncbi:hypothetical protein MBLNU459_g4023t1 [Dothideomycetes sp. NU459]